MAETSIDKFLSPKRRAAIVSLAQKYGAREAWLFGSAVARNREFEPRDIDVALVGIPRPVKYALANDLIQGFPGARTDDALSYTKQPQVSASRLHFLLCDECGSFERHAISHAVRNGVCLWVAN